MIIKLRISRIVIDEDQTALLTYSIRNPRVHLVVQRLGRRAIRKGAMHKSMALPRHLLARLGRVTIPQVPRLTRPFWFAASQEQRLP